MRTKHPLASLALACTLAAAASTAGASTFTAYAPSGIDLAAAGVTDIGGIAIDLQGVSGQHLVSQVSASSLSTLWNWFSPIQFGAQTGLSSGLTDALGGGLARASFRFTLWDGDSAAGDTGHGTQTLRVNGVEIGNWSDVDAQQTDSVGDAGAGGFSGGGFRSDTLDTGWFDVTDSALLTPLFAAMDAADSLAFVFVDTSSIDNYLDFTVGLDVLPLNAALPPTLVTPPPAVPLPGTGALTALALLGALGAGRRRR